MSKRVNREARFLLRGILRMPSLGLGKQQIAAIERIMDERDDVKSDDDSFTTMCGDRVVKEIFDVLAKREWIWKGTAEEMVAAILNNQDHINVRMILEFSPRRVGKALTRISDSSVIKAADPYLSNCGTIYRFFGLKVGQSVIFNK